MKKITVAVVLDDREGMMLFGKRQSRDRVMISEFVTSNEGKEIFISPFSKLIFEPHPNVKIVENPFLESTDGSACFIENFLLSPYLDMIETLIIYRWNRRYPSDVRFDVNVDEAGYKLQSVIEYEGSSHDKITKETYTRS